MTNCHLKAWCIIDETRCADCHFTPSLLLSPSLLLAPPDHFVNSSNSFNSSSHFLPLTVGNPTRDSDLMIVINSIDSNICLMTPASNKILALLNLLLFYAKNSFCLKCWSESFSVFCHLHVYISHVQHLIFQCVSRQVEECVKIDLKP